MFYIFTTQKHPVTTTVESVFDDNLWKWLTLAAFRGSATLYRLIFQLCFIMLNMKLYVCRNLCENFRQIGQKMKKL